MSRIGRKATNNDKMQVLIYKLISKNLSFYRYNSVVYTAGKFIQQCVLVKTDKKI